MVLATDDNKILYRILILCFEGAASTSVCPYNSATRCLLLLWVEPKLAHILSTLQLLMDQESDYDQSLQDSLEELHGQHPEGEDADEGSGEEQAGEELGEEGDGRGNRRQRKDEDEGEKHDYYAEMLAPDEDVESTPPFVVVVQGSTSSGKSSVIRSLVKHYTKHKVDEVAGTITLRSNKKQRITIVECPSDIGAMIDLAKVADIVLLVIDASLSFEMETFEFLSLLKCHGFPTVLGVLTHLDFFRDNKQLRKTRKKFKKRFEYEVGGNAKLFPLSTWEKGVYPKIEVAKLARYIGTAKPPAFPWRFSHPYLVADRWHTAEDAHYRPDDEVNVSFYGYVRGSSYRVNGKIHLVGLGDFPIANIEVVNDPCPEYKKEGEQAEEELTKGDAEEVEGEQASEGEGAGEGEKVVAQISKKRKKRRTLSQSERIIYAPSCNLGTLNFDYNSGYITIPHDYVKFTKVEDQRGEEEEGVRIVRNLQEVRQSINSQLRSRNGEFELLEGVGIEGDEQEVPETQEQHFRKKQAEIRQIKKETQALELVNPHADSAHRKTDLVHLIYESKEPLRSKDNSKFQPEGVYSSSLQSLFVTGMEEDVLHERGEETEQQRQERELERITQRNNVTRAKIGEQTNFYRKGLYVKVTLEGVRYEAFRNMKPALPVILARVNLGEDSRGFIKTRFKRHRWYNNLMRSTDPIIVSSGWRRYQTIPIFATEDENERLRYLKYTPQHDFCYSVFYGNFSLQNSGCIFLQTVRNDLRKFRIAASGVVLEMNKSFEIMKKIKLIGQPFKVLKNTAFVKGMFNSSIEVASYIGAQIRTVSGIRGQIKKALREGGQGAYRATFEDKISMSDLVFCRAWYKVVLERYYSPILTFQKQFLMKTKYELRMDQGIELDVKKDSEYKTIDRAPRTFMPFSVPKKLEAKLPFKTVEKVRESKKAQIRRAESLQVPKLLQGDQEREVAALIQRLNTIKHMKDQKREEKFKEKQRIRQARERPKQEYYEKLKKEQKSEKMAGLMRKKRKDDNRNRANDD